MLQPDLYRDKQTRYIHVFADETGDRFRCGRTLSEAYIQLSWNQSFAHRSVNDVSKG